MKRSSFLKRIGAAAVAPVVIDKFPVSAMAPQSIMSRLAQMATNTDHVLVLIELNGGNDGLNTVIPVDQYSNLTAARPKVIMSENKLLSLNGTNATKLHPALSGMRNMYNDGKLKIIQSVGYPNQNFSHFRSTDIWFSASDAAQYVTSGMVGRYLNMEFPNFPTGYPNTSMPDPLAIHIGGLLNLMFQGPSATMGMAISNANDVFNPVPGIPDPAPGSYSGAQLEYVRLIASQTSAYSKVIKAAADKVTQHTTYPSNNELANQLKIISKLIKGGLKTRVYQVSLGGFDTHSNQVVDSDKTTGLHANLLKTLSDAISAFQADLEFQGIADRVVGLTVSEFGRRIKSNDSQGTDHGAAAPMFVFGKPVDGGKILGKNPTIAANVGVEDNLPMQYDFRSVYATILRDWFCLSDADVQTIMMKQFDYLNLFTQSCQNAGIHLPNSSGEKWIKCFPSPTSIGNTVKIEFLSKGVRNAIEVFDYSGRLIEKIHDRELPSGSYFIEYNTSKLTPGNYIVRIANINGIQSTYLTVF